MQHKALQENAIYTCMSVILFDTPQVTNTASLNGKEIPYDEIIIVL
ncbi:MAG: hypothetical protein HDS97_05700 [Bacteroidales bacterium]|nr:hypothetical protein [Bacteroidales bacterium]